MPLRARILVSLTVISLTASACLTAFAPAARADGDPASDVLATQTLFLAQDSGVPFAQQGQLSGLLASAASSGYAIRAAIVASPSDLGSVTELWRQPQTYAEFLGQELSLVYHGRVLVVMPDGFGLYDGSEVGGAGQTGGGAAQTGERAAQTSGGAAQTGERATLSAIHIGAGTGSLGLAALTAIQRLAAAAGHPLAIPPAANPPGSSGSSNAIPIVVFALGALLIMLAWTASLRARPPSRWRARRS